MANTPQTARVYYRRRDVQLMLGGISNFHFRRLLAAGDFPAPRRIENIGVEVWASDEIEEYMSRQPRTHKEG